MTGKGFSSGLIAVLVPLVFGAACSKEDAKRTSRPQAAVTNTPLSVAGTATNGFPRTFDELTANDVIVSVDGATLTKQQFVASGKEIIERLSKTPNMKAAQITATVRRVVAMMVPRFVSTKLMVAEARRQGVLPDEELKKKTDQVLENLAKKAGKSRSDYLETVPGGAEKARLEAEEAVLVDAVVTTNVFSKVAVSDAFVTATVEAIQAENAAIGATNALKVAKLNEWRKSIEEGRADFGKLADQYSECARSAPGNNGYWGRFERNEFADRKLRATIFALKPGVVSEVVEDDEGFHLVKVSEYHAAVKNQKGTVIEPEAASLYHILLKRVPALELPLPNDLKKQIVIQQRQKALDAYIDSLKAKAQIVYPYGTNVWAKAEVSLLKP